MNTINFRNVGWIDRGGLCGDTGNLTPEREAAAAGHFTSW